MVKPKTGWAVLDRDGINVATVGDTRRAALVNWLCVKNGFMMLQHATDEQIEAMWAKKSGTAICTTVEINIYGQSKNQKPEIK